MDVKVLFLIIYSLYPVLAIYGGNYVSEQADFNYQVSIRLKYYETPYGNGYVCSGALISRISVITSAQCVYNYQDNKIRDPKEFRVVLGSLWRTKFYPTLLERDVAKITIHKNWDSRSNTHENDIAIIRLVNAISQNAIDIGPIEMRNNNNTNNLAGKISAWGDVANTLPTVFSDVLKKIDVSVQQADKCKTLMPSLAPGQICVTTTTNGSTCFGDLGAPFVVNRQLIGFVSEEKACLNTMTQPTVITSVAYHKRWIDANAGINLKSLSLLILLIISFVVSIIVR